MEDSINKYASVTFNVVLIHPQIPTNTGNIGRTCVAMNSRLHLIAPLGFEITDARLKRAGLDYWPDLEICHYDSIDHWFEKVEDPNRCFFFTKDGQRSLYDLELCSGDWLIFGQEAAGFSADVRKRFEEQLVSLPFPGKVRSFNLSNAVAMALGEGLRQLRI